jgi:hypothetical protein
MRNCWTSETAILRQILRQKPRPKSGAFLFALPPFRDDLCRAADPAAVPGRFASYERLGQRLTGAKAEAGLPRFRTKPVS